jgi:hypothetical protein
MLGLGIVNTQKNKDGAIAQRRRAFPVFHFNQDSGACGASHATCCPCKLEAYKMPPYTRRQALQSVAALIKSVRMAPASANLRLRLCVLASAVTP